MQESKYALIGVIAALALIIAIYAAWQGSLLAQQVTNIEKRVTEMQLTPKVSANVVVPDDLKSFVTIQGNTVSFTINVTGNVLNTVWAKYFTGDKPILKLEITGPTNAFPFWLEVYAESETTPLATLYQGWQIGVSDPTVGGVIWGKYVVVTVTSPSTVVLYLKDFYMYGKNGTVTLKINVVGRW